jgi:hypothetical protein
MPPGNCDSQSKPFVADILSVQTAHGRSLLRIQGGEEAQYYPSQYRLYEKTLL